MSMAVDGTEATADQNEGALSQPSGINVKKIP